MATLYMFINGDLKCQLKGNFFFSTKDVLKISSFYLKGSFLDGFDNQCRVIVECRPEILNMILLLCLIPWVPEVFRGPLRDLPAEGRLTSGKTARKPLALG